MSYQQITIVGNIGRDAELRDAQGVPVCNFTVAVNERRGQGESRTEVTTWFRVAAWRQLAQNLSPYLVKGKQVLVVGTIQARAYADNNGQPQASLELTAREIRLLGSRADSEPGGNGGYPRAVDSYRESDPTDNMSDIPF